MLVPKIVASLRALRDVVITPASATLPPRWRSCRRSCACGVVHVPAAGGTTPLEGDDADDRLRTLGADHDLARRHHSPTSVLLFPLPSLRMGALRCAYSLSLATNGRARLMVVRP